MAYVRCFPNLTIFGTPLACICDELYLIRYWIQVPGNNPQVFFALQIIYLSLVCNWPWDEWLCLSLVTRCLCEFYVELTFDHLLCIITYYYRQNPLLLKKKGTTLYGHHCSASLARRATNQSQCQIFVHTYHLSCTLCWQTMYRCTILYLNWWSFVFNCPYKDWCNTVQTPCCVVQLIELSDFFGELPYFFTTTKWSSISTFKYWPMLHSIKNCIGCFHG